APERWRVENWEGTLSYLWIVGESPKALLEHVTAYTGRPLVPAPWAFAPWVDRVGGEDVVLELAQTLRDNDVPVSAIWSEDWAGGSLQPLSGFKLTYWWGPVDE